MTFDFSTFPVLTTERLYLRQLTVDDAPAMQAIFSDAEVLRFLNNTPTETLDQAIGMIEWLNGVFATDDAVNWAITDKESGRFIGICGTHNWHKTDRRVDVGYTLARDEWGKGYATEVTRAMLAWCFENLDVHRVQADITDGNIGSERVLLKCGFKVEGIWRESCWEHERFVDIKQFGILRREYISE